MTTHKLRNAYICKNGKCIQLRILQMKNMNEDLILGTEFFISITPYLITTQEGLLTNIDQAPILFEFTEKPRIGQVDNLINAISLKKQFSRIQAIFVIKSIMKELNSN